MAVGYSYRVDVTALNLRAGPGRDQPVLKVLRRGTLVVALDDRASESGRRAVSCDGHHGFAAARFLTSLKAAGPASPSGLEVRSSDLSRLHPRVRVAVTTILATLDVENIPLRVFEAYRTPERQQQLYDQGRDGRPGKIVAFARAWESSRQYGLAADFVAFEDGRWSWRSDGGRGQWWQRLHVLGKNEGLVPLSFELPHLQLDGIALNSLKAGDWPSDGDAAWRDGLDEAVARWTGAPGAPVLAAARPPLVV